MNEEILKDSLTAYQRDQTFVVAAVQYLYLS